MAHSNILISLSSNTLLGEKAEWDTHYHWNSIKMFLSIATTMSSCIYNYDIFSKTSSKVRIFDFCILESTVGLSYLCMDVFIKLYTRGFSCDKYLNPLLRGISYGQFLQSGYFSILHGSFIAETIRFLTGAIREVPSWSRCAKDINMTCVSTKDILLLCTHNVTTTFNETSAFLYYINYFTYDGKRTTTTSRLFVSAIAWIITFFLSSVTEETIIKIFRLCFVFRLISSIVTVVSLLIATKAEAQASFFEILNATAASSWIVSMEHVTYTYGIGFLGMYDFGKTSPYTMIDTACVFFMISFTILAFIRSWIVRILYLVMVKCIDMDASHEISTHKLFYAVLPLTTEFLHAQKLYLLYLFGNLALTLLSFETFIVSTMSRFLYDEFRRVKHIYIVGLVCAIGFGISVFLIAISTNYGKKLYLGAGEKGIAGEILVLYLSGFRAGIIMWLYGVKRFATDVHFWLGFQPTRFWIISWAVLPLILFGCLLNKVKMILQMSQQLEVNDIIWLLFTLIVVTSMQVKTIPRYLVRNNIIGLFIASKLYGPPEAEDRRRRQFYNEVTWSRKCIHNCMVIDEWFDCDHEPAVNDSISSMSESLKEPSLTDIYRDDENDKQGKQGDSLRKTSIHISG